MSNLNKNLTSAVSEAFKAKKLTEASRAHGLLGLLPVLATPALLSARPGKDEKPYLFTLSEFAFPVRKADGSVNGKLRSAQLAVILTDIYGVKAADLHLATPVKSLFNATFGAALWLHHHPDPKIGVNGEGDLTGVPFDLAFDCVDDNGQPTEAFKHVASWVEADRSMKGQKTPEGEKMSAAVRAQRFVCNGLKHKAYGGLKMPTSSQIVAKLKAKAIEEGLIPPSGSKDRDTDHPDDGVALLNSMRFIGQTVAAWNDPDDDSDTGAAFSEDIASEIRRLAPVLAHWVANNPKAD